MKEGTKEIKEAREMRTLMKAVIEERQERTKTRENTGGQWKGREINK